MVDGNSSFSIFFSRSVGCQVSAISKGEPPRPPLFFGRRQDVFLGGGAVGRVFYGDVSFIIVAVGRFNVPGIQFERKETATR